MDSKQKSKKTAPTALKKAVNNINKLIGAGDVNVKSLISARYNHAPNSKPRFDKPSVQKKISLAKVYPDRGVVYLGHIPHGFYESEMKAFFRQFGHITRLRLVRSHKTGNSKGYAFIEFRFKEVAQVVADTMNNYLMGNRLLKAVFLPPEKQSPKMFAHSINYGPETCIGVKNRKLAILEQNKLLDEGECEVRVKKTKDSLLKLQEKLKAQGVDCLFQVDDGSSKRLSEETEPLPSSKRARTSSPPPKAKPSKATEVKQSVVGPTLKKKLIAASKGQTSQKSVISIKNVKPTEKSSKKSSTVVEKVAVVKNAVKKPAVKKNVSVKKVAKKVVKKTDGPKKSAIKKSGAKKK